MTDLGWTDTSMFSYPKSASDLALNIQYAAALPLTPQLPHNTLPLHRVLQILQRSKPSTPILHLPVPALRAARHDELPLRLVVNRLHMRTRLAINRDHIASLQKGEVGCTLHAFADLEDLEGEMRVIDARSIWSC